MAQETTTIKHLFYFHDQVKASLEPTVRALISVQKESRRQIGYIERVVDTIYLPNKRSIYVFKTLKENFHEYPILFEKEHDGNVLLKHFHRALAEKNDGEKFSSIKPAASAAKVERVLR